MFARLVGKLQNALRTDSRPQPARAKHFTIEDYVALLERVRAEGAVFEGLAAPDVAGADARRVHYLKHDIHHDLVNTHRMAVAEARAGITATYFMMPRDALNRTYFDAPQTWAVLREIRDLGHDIGLHVCGFSLIETFGDLAAGIEDARATFRREGLEFTIGNTHGHSEYQKALRFDPMNFYKELARPTDADDPFWMAHYAKYSLADLGFRIWADTTVWIAGHGEWTTRYFVSDNSSGINAGLMTGSEWAVTGAPFDLSPAHRQAVATFVGRGSCLYLIHPQYFRPAARG